MVFISVDLTQASLIEFIQVLERIGFKYCRLNTKTIQNCNCLIITHEMIRNYATYRTHFFLQYYRNKLGNGYKKRVKIYGHVDVFKITEVGNRTHYFDSTGTRIQKDLRIIRNELKESNIGHFSYKDSHSVHASIKLRDDNQREKVVQLIKKEYREVEPGKFRRITIHQTTNLWLVQQNKYLHLVLCSENTHNPGLGLNMQLAKQEFKHLKQIIQIIGVECF
jgi:hypothetical protein